MKMKVPIPADALFKRAKRELAKDGKQLHASRIGRMRVELGEYFITDADYLVAKDVDLEALARKLGVLADWEALKTEPGAGRVQAGRAPKAKRKELKK